MKNRTLKFLLLGLLFTFSCKKENLGDCFKSTGKIESRMHVLPPFHSIELENRINAYLSYGQQSVELEAGKNLHQNIDLSVQDGVLRIADNNKCNWVRDYAKPINVRLKTTDLRSIRMGGSGEFVFEEKMNLDSLEVSLWEASGEMRIIAELNHLSILQHTGSADVYCEGNTFSQLAYMNGSGFINCTNLTSERSVVANQNTGKIIVQAAHHLDARISGSGNIYYIGFPSEIILKDTGKGALIKQ